MFSLNSKNSKGEENQPVLSLYDKNKYSFDYKLDPKIKKPDAYLYLDNNSDEVNDYVLIDDLGGFKPEPFIKKNGFHRIFISCGSGQGKSTACANVIKQFLDANNGDAWVCYYNSNPVDDKLEAYFKEIGDDNICVVSTETILKGIEYNKNKKDNEKWRCFYSIKDINELLFKKNETRKPLMIVFDDIDGECNKVVKNGLIDLERELLLRGRAHSEEQRNINVVVISHTPLGGHTTSFVYNETDWVVLGNKSTTNSTLETVLGKKSGYSNEVIKTVLKKKREGKSRLIWISKVWPYIIFCDDYVIGQF